MPRADFYHLQRFRLEDALPRLLDRVLASGQRAVVLTESPERAEALTLSLWESAVVWLPHGNANDGHPERHPIWLTSDPTDCPNGATVLVLCDGMDAPPSLPYARTLDLFNGHDAAATQAARQRWKQRAEAGYDLYYWQQDDAGRWSEKAKRLATKEEPEAAKS